MDRVRVLFLPMVDARNTNAQSLNVREIVLRLDPTRLESTVFYEQEPDARLCNRNGIGLVRLPEKGKTRRILVEMLRGYDIIAYMDYSPASYLFLHLPRIFRWRTNAVFHLEGPTAGLVNATRLLRILFKGVTSHCDVYTAITDFVAHDLQSSLKKSASYTLPVGVDTELFAPPVLRSNSRPSVLFAGTLVERKGPQHVVEAAARFPEADFHLVGAGRHGYDDFLRKMIAERNLNNVILDGPRTQLQLLETMKSSDIFILPSRYEGIPKVTLEAAATGLPCVIFGDYESPSVVHGITGFQVATLDEMMSALSDLIHDPSLRERMGTAARKHVLQFDWDIVSKHWQNAYLEIASTRQH
jgi:glycosyltransferase involved in cell wall biosynthesis